MIMKMWKLMLLWIIGSILSTGFSIGIVLLCIWLGIKIVKAAF